MVINQESIKNTGEILGVLEDMRNAGIIDKYAIGGAFAAILHYEPISTIRRTAGALLSNAAGARSKRGPKNSRTLAQKAPGALLKFKIVLEK